MAPLQTHDFKIDPLLLARVVHEACPLKDAAPLVLRDGWPFVAVTDASGSLAGILAVKEICRGLAENPKSEVPAGSLCNREAKIIRAVDLDSEETRAAAAEFLADFPHITYFPVVNMEGRPIGQAYRPIPPEAQQKTLEMEMLVESMLPWSAPWGGDAAAWYGYVLPRIASLMPAERILEIGTGFGRWSHYLIPLAKSFIGIEVNAPRLEMCRRRFADKANARFLLTQGVDLSPVEDDSCDFIFTMQCFSVANHMSAKCVYDYIPHFMRVLKPGGRALVHHGHAEQDHFRSAFWVGGRAPQPAINADSVRERVERAGGCILVQECINYTGLEIDSCLTLFAKEPAGNQPPRCFINGSFMAEASLIKAHILPWVSAAAGGGQ